MTSVPLDADGLLWVLDDPATAAFAGLPHGTVMGHVHLRVAESRRPWRSTATRSASS